ncbi:hypothetical protein WICANDRAFT_55818 [Wickerhamomyces anomalus NRRL Y-366-8]|uniref:Peroxin/Ferlin domain-containing protein n=1 Tax=Wickerhamomyces anomalus (strain ATCC 58044 / CBS 1984 / NCYC 433 / NRRL Y-366-8) TaxID=683960 RepID=A0A1E3P1C4_WICAA|nr:uncharacterized protein WICANDRAFT_55818 [Wickerhamomyces anomalus NRRL Y-366-8]ODQ59251.1 hypothetical protein WICANDRAFT_55818 [Wickerhamomyces anomalus NRRL Y-366-8]
MTISLISNDQDQIYQDPEISFEDKNNKPSIITNYIIPKYKLDQIVSNCIENLSKQKTISSTTTSTTSTSSLEYSYDLLIENERGFIIFGLPFYTKYMFPFDPPNFTNINGSKISNLKLFPLPDLNWKWSWDKWYVIMNDDNDDQGWCYSWRFGSKHWRGEQRLGCFVRRRIWLRLRERKILA